MSGDVNPVPTNETEPTLPPHRAVPERIEPVTEDDLFMEDLLEDVDTISAAEQEELAGGNLVGASPDDEPVVDKSPQFEEFVQDGEPVPEAEGAQRETTVITPVSTVEENFYPPPVEPTYPGTTETAVLAPASVVAAATPSNDTDAEITEEDEVGAALRPDRGTIDFGLFLLRVTLGAIMALHGADKLLGLFGGSIASTEQLLRSIGFTNYTELLAIGAGVTELVGGSIVALGLFAPAGASALLGVMGMATLTHLALGDTAFLSIQKGLYEIITLIAVMAATVILAGAGRWSVDGRWSWATCPKWGALVWLLVGIISAPVMWAVLNTQGFPF